MNSTYARHSFVGGLIGGTLGYLLCGLTGNIYAQILGFFVFGYLGYDLRQVIETTRTQVPVMWQRTRTQLGSELDDMWTKHPLVVILSPLLPLLWFVLFAKMMDLSIPDRPLQGDLSLWGTPHLFLAKLRWLATGIGGEGMLTDYSPLRRVCELALMLLMTAASSIFLWGCLVTVIKATYMVFKSRTQIGSAFMTLPLHFAWILFWLVPGLLIGVAKLVASVLSLVHSARRVTTGLATAAGGMAYLYFVPFHAGLPLPAAAILCGLCTGVCARMVSTLLDYAKLNERLSAFLATPISAWSPLPVPAWVRFEQEVSRLNKRSQFHNR